MGNASRSIHSVSILKLIIFRHLGNIEFEDEKAWKKALIEGSYIWKIFSLEIVKYWCSFFFYEKRSSFTGWWAKSFLGQCWRIKCCCKDTMKSLVLSWWGPPCSAPRECSMQLGTSLNMRLDSFYLLRIHSSFMHIYFEKKIYLLSMALYLHINYFLIAYIL